MRLLVAVLIALMSTACTIDSGYRSTRYEQYKGKPMVGADVFLSYMANGECWMHVAFVGGDRVDVKVDYRACTIVGVEQ